MAPYATEVHREAVREAAEAVIWYQARSPAAADGFAAAVREALLRVDDSPELSAIYMDDYRATRVGRYPYIVVYRWDGSTSQVLAVAHTSRRPGYWKNRTF